MVKRTYDMPEDEPTEAKFEIPSVKEHLFVVTDIITQDDEIGAKMGLDDNTICAKCEVVGGNEEGRTLLNRVSLDEGWKGFFFTRLFLKAIGEPCRGKGIEVDSDRWVSRQFYATVKHSDVKGKTYANIDEYNFDKKVEAGYTPPVTEPSEIQWSE